MPRYMTIVFLFFLADLAPANSVELVQISERVYVESPTDTDSDGLPDRIYVSIDRPNVSKKVSSLFYISPYAMGGNQVKFHGVDSKLLPQDRPLKKRFGSDPFSVPSALWKPVLELESGENAASSYARLRAHSVGTGKSTGCPTVGDMSETLAAKAVIDWLNGRARAFYEDGREAKANWANGSVGMTGTSYDGTLPIMVATTGVEGLKAIVPVAAISNWYDYYRANGLVVNPGGYIGEDADILGLFIVRKGSCQNEIERISKSMGREHGDFTPFWQERDYLSKAKDIKAATFIIHGQSDWNVKQKQAIQLWEALADGAPRRMFLHRGGHSSTSRHDVPQKVQAWFDHFVDGIENGITEGPQVEVEFPDGSLMKQNQWPHEAAQALRLYLSSNYSLSESAGAPGTARITDVGIKHQLEVLMEKPELEESGRLIFTTDPLREATLITGTSTVTLSLAVLNRRAANITVALIEYDASGKGNVITRGWADPQNFADQTQGELLAPGRRYQLTFTLEPKQYRIAKGKRLGVLVTATDFDYTLRPEPGTEIRFDLGAESFVDLTLADR